ncbi:AraC-like DNA-binding protein [Prosthecobacter fusiformis]|uniref:AraC-like DNA-binding protein n=1 Tax=Prosthecobacter fusiformis TaxID=48464 RepID=A0A4R7SR44_9BACT|nr:AraC family transcriptional regulator [Prosthecobacter fusiformis]TDU81414.1 AraC-like DNA-binding protein [Prosthecobacter fusiformis]
MASFPSTYQLKASELDEVYVAESNIEEHGLVVESHYVPLVPWVQGSTTTRTVRPGFYMHWADEFFDRELRLRCNEELDFYVITFALEGHWQEISGARRRTYDRHAGTMALIRFSQSKEHRAMPTAQAKQARHLTVAIEGSQLRHWLTDRELTEHPQWRRFLNGEGDPCIVAPLTPRARLVVEQIQNCPFQGACRALSMEARCLDLIVEMIVALSPAPLLSSRRLTSQDQERIYAAAELLRKSLEAPPTLMELATRVSLSESKLKSGFHQVFGTTTFGYLRQQRLEKARLLLERGDCTILDASHMVGISNPSHFATLFKQQFGMNPKQFQLNATRQK